MPSKGRETEQICGVCGGPNAVVHFGAITCRACGAFFRRVVALGITFECFCGIGNYANFSYSNNVLNCKGCRQRKCLEIGMDKESVRAAKLQAFHRKRINVIEKDEKNWPNSFRPQILHNNELDEKKFVEKMQQIVGLVQIVCGNPNVIADDYFEQNENLDAIIMDKRNLLANSLKLIPDTHEALIDFNKYELLDYIKANGIFGNLSRLSTKVLMVSIGVAKTLSIFGQLKLEDQISLVKNSCDVFTFLWGNYYSAMLNSPALPGPVPGTTCFELFAVLSERYSDPIISKASEKIFIQPVASFTQTNLLAEEFAMLSAMVFLNSANSGLSGSARHLLKEEEEKYGRALLRLQQRRMGFEAGARRYTETLGLLWATINQAQNYRELAIYIDARYEQDQYRLLVPKALVPLLG